MTSTAKVELAYAPKPRRRRRRLWVALIAFVLLATTSIILRNWEIAVWRQGVYLYWQHRCLTYIAPPDKIVYEDDPIAAANLIATDKNYHPPRRVLYPLSSAPWRPALYDNPELQLIVRPSPFGAVFIYERLTATGSERLVLVELDDDNPGFRGRGVTLYGTALSIATWTVGTSAKRFFTSFIDYGLAGTDHLQLYAGQPDPADPSRFTIRYSLNGTNGVIEGQLLDAGHWKKYPDSEGVKLQVRDGPLRRFSGTHSGRQPDDWQQWQ